MKALVQIESTYAGLAMPSAVLRKQSISASFKVVFFKYQIRYTYRRSLSSTVVVAGMNFSTAFLRVSLISIQRLTDLQIVNNDTASEFILTNLEGLVSSSNSVKL